MKRQKRKKSIPIILRQQKWFIALGILLTILFIARGWIRDIAVPTVVNTAVGTRLEKTTDQVFAPVNVQFKQFNLIPTYPEHSSLRNREPCGLAYFVNFSETIACSVSLQGAIPITDTFLTQWKQKSPAVEDFLLRNGWTRVEEAGFTYFPLAELYDGTSRHITFKKQWAGAECNLYLDTNPAYPGRPNREVDRASISEGCRRDVKIFGGSDELHSPGLFE